MSETYLDSSTMHKKGPSKPPLPHAYTNLLDSIPNSAQLASIANAALQSVMHIPETPPPPPLHLLQAASDSNPNVFARIPTPQSARGGPPGLPLPPSTSSYPKTSSSSMFNFSSTNIPALSPSPIPVNFPQHSNQLLNHINNTSAHHLLSTPSLNTVDSHSDVASQSVPAQQTKPPRDRKSSRARSRKTPDGNSQPDEEDEDGEIEDRNFQESVHSIANAEDKDGDSQDGEHEAKMMEEESVEEICVAKRNLINAIELERRNHELTKLRLIQLHKYFGEMIKDLKQENLNLKSKASMYKNVPSQNELESVLKQKEEIRNQYLRKKSIRLRDEEQIKQTNKENQKLVIIIHYLRQQLHALEQQYQTLCRQQMNMDGDTTTTDAGFSEAERIVNTLDSLDIVDAESMISSELNLESSPHFPLYEGTDIAQQINDDPWFQKIIEENKMLERHIRFMKHIMEQETQRCNFREIIVGKQLLSPSKEKEKAKQKQKEEEEEEKENAAVDGGDGDDKKKKEKMEALQQLQCDEKKAESE